MKERMHAGTALLRISLALACVLMAILCLSGCRISDALTEVIYDQSSDIIDYDNPTKIYVNDSTAEVESDKFAAKEVSDDTDVVSSTVQNLVVYSSTPNTKGFTAKKSVFGYPPDFEGIEASEEVRFVKSDDPDAYDHALTVSEQEEEPEEEEEEEEPEEEPQVGSDPTDDPTATPTTPNSARTQQSTTTPASTSESTTSPSDQSANSSKESEDPWQSVPEPNESTPQTEAQPEQTPEGNNQGEQNPSDENQNQTPQETDNGGGGNGGEVQVAYDAADPTADPPKVDKIAAFGPAATIVQMVGGKGALAATDSDTLASAFPAVFGEGAADVLEGWTGNGEDASQMNVDAIISSGAGTVLVYASTYFDALPEADREKLTKANVTQVVIYPLSNSGNIKHDVQVVGQVLSQSKGIQYEGQTEERAASYVAFHDEVVNAAANANGGLAGSRLFEGGSDSVPNFTADDSMYTLVIDEYDPSASFVGDSEDAWRIADGLAFASAGYSTTPLSYYLQAGGLVNTVADDQGMTASGKIAVWQFQKNSFPFNPSQWSSPSAQDAYAANGFSLLTTPVNQHPMLGFGSSFNTAWFPRLIATTEDVKQGILANSSLENGAYHQYDYVELGATTLLQTPVGYPACIGCGGSDSSADNLFAGGSIDSSAIVVNPKGLFSDWTQGTVESFLEAAWANDVVRGQNAIGWQDYVTRFYNEFYGYSLTESDQLAISADWSGGPLPSEGGE